MTGRSSKYEKNVFFWIVLLSFSILIPVSAEEPAVSGAVKYETKTRRDPFVPLILEAHSEISGLFGVESVDDIRLEGLIFDPKAGSIVIANGVVLKEGEEKDDVKVVSIQRDGVVFMINEREHFKPFQEIKEDKI